MIGNLNLLLFVKKQSFQLSQVASIWIHCLHVIAFSLLIFQDFYLTDNDEVVETKSLCSLGAPSPKSCGHR